MMKRNVLILLICLVSIYSWAQVPESFNYQAVVRETDGALIKEQNISVKVNILKDSEDGNAVYSETHDVKTSNLGLVNLKIGLGDNVTGDFSSIDWGATSYYLEVEMDKTGGTNYTSIGVSPLLSVPYSLYAKNLDKDVLYFTDDSDTLFAVKDRSGNVVFAVYPYGAQVYVSSTVKGNLGGFAVSGRGATKGDQNYLTVTPDSTRIFIDESVKGKLGGFAVSGRGSTKTGTSDYFNVSGRSSTGLDTINPSEARMLWYPKSEALLVGRVLIESPDSVGLNSIATGYESKAIGNYSQALGYRSIARDDYSTAIGKNALANGINSFAFGNISMAIGSGSYAIGSGALAVGENSFALGSVGVDTLGNLKDSPKAIGDFSFAMGLGTRSSGLGSVSIGANNVAVGSFSTALGFTSTAEGERSVAIGPYSKTYGYGSTAIGYRCETAAGGSFSFSAGLGCSAEGYGSVAIGSYSHATANKSIALGDGALSSGYGCVAIGDGAKAVLGADYAMGVNVTADGGGSFAFGKTCTTNGMTGAFIFSSSSDKYPYFKAARDYEMNFKAEGGYRFFTTLDTLESGIIAFTPGGNVGIGVKDPSYKLDVVGSVHVTGNIIVGSTTLDVPDFVFTESYNLESIDEHAEFMWREKHLPALTSAKQIEADGKINISERREQIVEELEKAHIYIEQLNNRIKALETNNEILKENQQLKERIEKLEELVNMLTEK